MYSVIGITAPYCNWKHAATAISHSGQPVVPPVVTDVPVLQSTWNSETADTNSGLVTKSWTLL